MYRNPVMDHYADIEPSSSHGGKLEASQHRLLKVRRDEINRVFDHINSLMRLPDKKSKCFIVYSDVQEVWKDSRRILKVLWPYNPDEASLRFIQQHMILILSCLIYVGSTDWLSNFRIKLWDQHRQQWSLTDASIPIPEDKLGFLDDNAAREAFHKGQHIFRPLVIQLYESQYTQKISKDYRLPFEQRQKNVGSGGFGVVDRVVIPPGYIQNAEGLSWNQVSSHLALDRQLCNFAN
jgi:hypothetical protein